MPSPAIFTSVINSYLPEPHASLLNGIIFGINLKTSYDFYERIKMVGLLHIVVLSGINITLLAVVAGNLTQFLGKRLSILITILIVILFIFFVGPKAPIVRAGFMGILTFVGILTERKTYVFFSLILSLFFIFIFWPHWLKTVSLQLSYGATLGLILFGQTKSANWLWKNFITSLAAQVFTAPTIFIYFKQLSLISPLSNVLVAEIIPALMVFGFLTAILGKINYYLGYLPAMICYGLLTYLVWIIETLSKLPFAFYQF